APPLVGADLQAVARVVVGVERGVVVLQLLQALVVLEVQRGHHQPAELAEQVALLRLEAGVGTEQLDQLAAAGRDEMLTVRVLGHRASFRRPILRVALAAPARNDESSSRQNSVISSRSSGDFTSCSARWSSAPWISLARSGRSWALYARQRWIRSRSAW